MRTGAALALAAFVLGLHALPALSQEASPETEAGKKLREALAKEGVRQSLEGDVRMSAHVGLSRVGSIYLGTRIEERDGEKVYRIEDRLNLELKGMGDVHATLTGSLAADLSVRELVLETQIPGKNGTDARHRLAVAPEGGALWLTETDDTATRKTKLAGLDSNALVLTPPLGVGDRLARLLRGESGTRVSFPGWDLSRGERGTLAVELGGEAKVDVRGTSLPARAVRREECKAKLELEVDPSSSEPLELVRRDGPARLVFVGREPKDAADLPAPADSARATEGPAALVLRFLRASGKGEKGEKDAERDAIRKEIASLLDMDALYARAKGDPADKRFRERFEKVLLDKLTREEWRRSGAVKLVAGSASTSDLLEEIDGTRARVRPKASPDLAPFELSRTEAGWKIAAFPEP